MTDSDPVESGMFSCDAARRRTLLYREGQLSPEEMFAMRRHLAQCPQCAEDSASVAELRRNLRRLPAPAAPPDLRMRLRVAASREASRRRARRTWQQRWSSFVSDLKLWTDNLMRPLALPAAGGFASAMVLFSVFASGMAVPKSNSALDVPTGLYTEASVKAWLPLGFNGDDDLVVELTIDEQGRVIDYKLPELASPASAAVRRNIENHLLFTQFNPATSFGQPQPGKVRLWFRSSRIDVKG